GLLSPPNDEHAPKKPAAMQASDGATRMGWSRRSCSATAGGEFRTKLVNSTSRGCGYGGGICLNRGAIRGRIASGLVSRFRSSDHRAAPSFANFGIEGHEQLIDLVWLWFRSPHFGLSARIMRTSEPPH